MYKKNINSRQSDDIPNLKKVNFPTRFRSSLIFLRKMADKIREKINFLINLLFTNSIILVTVLLLPPSYLSETTFTMTLIPGLRWPWSRVLWWWWWLHQPLRYIWNSPIWWRGRSSFHADPNPDVVQENAQTP